MKRNRYRKKKLPSKYILLIMTLVCIVSIFVGMVFNISGGPLHTAAGYIFVPMQKGINNTGNWFSDKTEKFRTLNDVLEENKQLKAQIDDMTSELNTVKLEKYELDNYRQLLELSEKYPSYEKVAASVIAKDSGNWFSNFTIDRGKKDGVDVGMNVMAGAGLVGIVTAAGDNYATVRSIISDSTKLSCMVSTTSDNFTVMGDLKLMNEQHAIVFSELRDTENKVAIGDPVVTSYVSDLFQQGILVGYISSIEENSNKLTKSGTITPVVDFEHLQEVLVIKELKQTGKEEAKTE